MRRETTAAMAANISRELREIRSALAQCRGHRVEEPRVMAAALAHLVTSSRDLLQNLLIDTARRPKLIVPVASSESLLVRASNQELPEQAANAGVRPGRLPRCTCD